MNRTVTYAIPLLLLCWCSVLQAQPVRTDNGGLTDIVWARDLAGASITHDGALAEAAWGQAETLQLTYEGTMYLAGGGWEIMGTFTPPAPTNPVAGTLRVLRDGNTLWLGLNVADQSIGGTRDFFQMDGVVISMVDRRNREDIYPSGGPTATNSFNGAYTDEFFYSWMDRDLPEGSPPVPGAMPVHFGNHGDDRALWEGMTVVTGTTNDDTGAPDTGYSMEIRVDLGMLGYDMNDADGDRVGMTLGLYDLDFSWPANPDLLFRTRAWFHNPWGGDMPNGTAYVAGHPSVTIASGAAPAISEPDLRLPQAGPNTVITLDGQMSEGVWNEVTPQVTLKYQMPEALLDALPGLGPWYTHWFRPGEATIPVVDPSTATIRFLYQGNTLYVGVDSDDQAISGQTLNENFNDGIRIVLRDLDPEVEDNYVLGRAYPAEQYRAVVDSTGNVVLMDQAAGNPAIQAAVFLKGSSTPGNPTDIDEGYQIEMAIDLTSLGYNPGGDRLIWLGACYLDGDDLDPSSASYGDRTWWLTERGSGPMARAYLDPTLIVAGEGGPGEPGTTVQLLGVAPNPASATTSIRYVLPSAGDVRLEVFDVLGRRVVSVASGAQSAGVNETVIDAASLAPGAYIFRLSHEASSAQTVSGRLTVTR